MRWQSLLSEAWRNTCSGTTRAVFAAVTLTVIMASVVLLDGDSAGSIFRDQQAFVAAGGATVTITANREIDADRCVALSRVAGIQGAIALREVQGGLAVSTLPDTPPALFDEAGDPHGVLTNQTSTDAGVYLSREVATQLGVGRGDSIPVAGRAPDHASVAGVFDYPDDGRNQMLADSVIQPQPPTGAFDTCWFTVWPADPALSALARTTLSATAPRGTNVQITALNTTLGEPTSTATLLAERATRWLPAGGAVVCFAASVLLVRLRRLELAMARHLGQRFWAQAAELTIEHLVPTLISAAAAMVAVVIVTTRGLVDAELWWVVGQEGVRILGMTIGAVVGVVVGAATINARSLSTWAKDR
jgi:hypothetical protein